MRTHAHVRTHTRIKIARTHAHTCVRSHTQATRLQHFIENPQTP